MRAWEHQEPRRPEQEVVLAERIEMEAVVLSVEIHHPYFEQEACQQVPEAEPDSPDSVKEIV